MHFDSTGKVSFDGIYTEPDPRAYFRTLRELDYRIPQLAKPYFARLIQEYRETERIAVPTVVDLGCSYGINAALLKCDVSMPDLYERYSGTGVDALTESVLLARDRDLVESRRHRQDVRFVGLDVSYPALSYALQAGFLDGAVHADFERDEPTPEQSARLAATDLVISTGCLGYVGDRTLSRVVGASAKRKPWMAHFVLRMFPFDPVAEILAGWGYQTVRLDGVFQQRRFASAEEQSLVLDTLAGVGSTREAGKPTAGSTRNCTFPARVAATAVRSSTSPHDSTRVQQPSLCREHPKRRRQGPAT